MTYLLDMLFSVYQYYIIDSPIFQCQSKNNLFFPEQHHTKVLFVGFSMLYKTLPNRYFYAILQEINQAVIIHDDNSINHSVPGAPNHALYKNFDHRKAKTRVANNSKQTLRTGKSLSASFGRPRLFPLVKR